MKGAFNSWSVVLCCSLDPHLKVDQEREENHGLPSLQKETVWLIKLLCLAWAGRNCIVSFKAWRSNARVSWHLVWCQALPVSQLLLLLLKYESKRSCVPPPSHHHRLNLTAWTGKILLRLQLKLLFVVAILWEMFCAYHLWGHTLLFTEIFKKKGFSCIQRPEQAALVVSFFQNYI